MSEIQRYEKSEVWCCDIAECDAGSLVLYCDHADVVAAKDAEIERLKAQRDRLAIDHRTILSARMPTGFADTALAERFGLRIVGGQVEEIRE